MYYKKFTTQISFQADHFQEECFDHSCRLQREPYYSDCSVKTKLHKGGIPTILPYQRRIYNPMEHLLWKFNFEKS